VRIRNLRPIDLYGEYEMRSGRTLLLRVTPAPTGRDSALPIDHELMLSHLFRYPALTGRREEGGVFLLNPAAIVRFTAFPAPPLAPTAALPAGYYCG